MADALVYLIEHPEATVDDLMRYVPGPDFPTGATILGRQGICYHTGRGLITVRAKAEIDVLPNGRDVIIISEIPYQVNTMIERIAELVKEGHITGISDVRDGTGTACGW